MNAAFLVASVLVVAQFGDSSIKMIVFGVVGIAALAIAAGDLIRSMQRQETKRVDDRLDAGVSGMHKGAKTTEDYRKSLVKKSAIAATSGLVKKFADFKPIEKFQKACFQADKDWNAARVIVWTFVFAVGATFVLTVIQVALWRAALVGLGIFAAPIFYIRFLKKRRLNALVEQLPEVFDQMVAALRAGQSLPAALGTVAEQLADPARTEFGLVWQEQNLGITLEEALINMRDRLNQLDVSFFVTAVIVQKQSGGDLAEVLENIGGIIRARIKLFGQVKALTAEGRLSGVVLMGLPPVMMAVLFIINPGYANKLLQTDIGNNMLYAAGFSMVCGHFMIKKIITIEV